MAESRDDLGEEFLTPTAIAESESRVVLVSAPRRVRRFAIAPAGFVLALSIGAMAVRMSTSDWRGALPKAPSTPRTRAVETGARPVEPAARVAITVDAVEPPIPIEIAARDTQPESKVVEVRVQSAITPDQVIGGAKTALLPLKAAREVATEAWRQIEAEAARTSRRRQELAALKPALREAAERGSINRARADRQKYLESLRVALSDSDWAARLQGLAAPAYFGLETVASEPDLARSRARRWAWIVERRAAGIEEARILAGLAEVLSAERVRRDGPRTREEALRRAATELLSVSLDAKPADQPKAIAREEIPLIPANGGLGETGGPELRSRRRR